MSGERVKQHNIIGDAFRSLKVYQIGIALVSAVINILMLTGPLFMLQVYDRVLASGSVPTLAVLSALAFGLYVFYGLLEGFRARCLARIGQSIDAKLSPETYEISTSLPLILGAKSTQVRPVHDLDILRQFLSGPGPAAIFDIPWMPIYLGVVFLFHPVLGYTALTGGLMICILIGLKELISHKPATEFAKENARRNNLVEVARRNAEVVGAMGMMPDLKHNWVIANSEYLEKQRATIDMAGFFSTTIKTLRFLLQSAVLGIGAWLAIKQEISPGIMIAASIMTSRALAPVEQAVAHWSNFVNARQSKKRLQDVTQKSTSPEKLLELQLPKKSLSINELNCGPAGTKKLVVSGITAQLDSGDGLGIIGPSGSGKSTLARAIVGVAHSKKGAVRFDDADIEQFSIEQIGKFIGYLPQDVQLFDGTVSENIARFSNKTDAEAVIAAAQLADIHQLITSLPEGYNTSIGASGFALSAGQKQRIALARALYKSPFLIVLDEPNSNLDSDGEIALTNAIKAMRDRGSIVIVIAHRPSAITAVNKVLVMKEGKQAAFGPKDDVLQKVLAPVPAISAAGGKDI